MATYSLTINERTALGKGLVQFLSTLPHVTFEKIATKTAKKGKNGLDEALDDIKAGRVTDYDSVDDMFKKLGINV